MANTEENRPTSHELTEGTLLSLMTVYDTMQVEQQTQDVDAPARFWN